LLGVLLLLSEACSSNPPSKAQAAPAEPRDPYTTAAIHSRGIASPVGRLALLRKGTAVCAVRFTSFQRERDASAPLPSQFGEEVMSAEYDWYLLPNKNHGFTERAVKSGHEVLTLKQNTGIGRFSFRRGTRVVRCGSMELGWGYPNWLSLVVVSDDKLRWNGIEIAPTAWQHIGQVNVADPSLRWYRHDEAQPDAPPLTEVPATDLPGGK